MTSADRGDPAPGEAAAPLSSAGEWRRGWPLVLLSVLGLAINNVMVYSLGVLVVPIQHETGWTRADIFFGLPVATAVSFVVIPIVGWLSDRVELRWIVTPGVLVFGLAIMAVSVLSTGYWTFIASWLVAQSCGALLSVTVWFAAVSRVFHRQRGLAMAITMCGTAVAGAVVPLITSQLIAHFDWRRSYFMLGAGILGCLLPLLLAFRHMDGLGADGSSRKDRSRHDGIPIGILFRSRHFISLTLVSFVMLAALSAFALLYVSMLTAHGLSIEQAAAIAGLIGVSAIFGRLTTGAAMDHSAGPLLGALCFALPMVTAVLLLSNGSSAWVAGIGALSVGFAAGAEMNMIGYVATRYFGTRGFGQVFSFLAVAMSAGFGLGPWAAALSADLTRSYDLFLISVLPLCALGGVTLATLGPWRNVLPEAAAGS